MAKNNSKRWMLVQDLADDNACKPRSTYYSKEGAERDFRLLKVFGVVNASLIEVADDGEFTDEEAVHVFF